MAGWLLFLLLMAWPAHEAWATGACTAARFHDWNDMGCNQNDAGAGGVPKAKCPDCGGMPVWWVHEPYINLCMADTPLSYTMSSGQEMAFKFYYRQRFKLPEPDEVPDYYFLGNAPYLPRSDGDYYLANVWKKNAMTNAAWGHGWMSDIVFWDLKWESYPPFGSPPNYDYRIQRLTPIFSDGFYEAMVFNPEGGIYYFYSINGQSSLQESRSQARLQPLSSYPLVTNQPSCDADGIYWGDSDMGFKLIYPDGRQDVFSLCYYLRGVQTYYGYSANLSTTARALLTQRIDPQGRVTQLGYGKITANGLSLGYRLKYVVDPDSRTNMFLYTTTNNFQLAEIDDPYVRKATLGYDSKGRLSRITDAIGLTNVFSYQGTNGWITNLATPYGNTSFSYYEVPDTSVTNGFQQRAIYISEPEGAHQLYYFLHHPTSAGLLTTTATAPTVPGQTDFDDGTSGANHPTLDYRNTFHWDRRQFAALSAGVLYNLPSNFSDALAYLTAADFRKGRLRNWLWHSDGISITESLSSERDPSPDAQGQIEGARTWYNYAGKPSPETVGSNPQVSCVARLLPDGSSQYTTYNYYSGIPGNPPGAGFVSYSKSSYSRPDGTVGTLTNWYHYAGNSVDLISVSNSAGQWWNLGYNDNHQINFITNALNQVTTVGWDSYTFNLRSIQFPGGKSVDLNYYDYFGPPDVRTNASALIQQITIQPEGRVFTINNYQAGNPSSITDDRNLTVANTWDGLNRLTGTVFPDGTSVSNIYKRLDLGATKDRLGNWTRYGYDGLQHLTAITNANNAVTFLSWCDCGSLSSIVDALNNTNTLNYDNQGNLTSVLYPDNTSLTYQFDLAGRMTNAFDGASRSVRLSYNNQGLATNLSGASGSLESIIYDALNRPISVTDANSVTVSNTFDAINELLKRTWPDGISESYGYSAAGLMAYTNRDQKVTRFGRDAAGRLTAVTNANQEVTQFGYDSLDNIISLVDGLQHTTRWQYNEYGWLTNKVDGLNRNVARYAYNANGWVTNRWTPEKGNAGYTYDNVRNLKTITYPQSTNTYAYDALNRLTNMLDALGATAFSYTNSGPLQSENGPWVNDSVTYTLAQGLRTAMSLNSQPSTLNFSYGYDTLWRMTNVVSPAGTFGYNYNSAVSPLVSRISLPNEAAITNGYDSLARLTRTALNNSSGQTLDAYSYLYDPLGLRTNVTRNLGSAISTATAGYDAIGQLTGWSAMETNTVRLNEQLGWAYDAAHNLHGRTNGALIQTFTVDAANELITVVRNNTFTVAGDTLAPATSVTVNGQAAQTYGDLTFAGTNNSLINGNNTFTTIAQNAGGTRVTNSSISYLPSSDSLLYDNNGNLTNDGLRSFSYDNENQLTNVMVVDQWRAAYVYDGLGRRRIARDYTWQSGHWVPTNEIHYVYDRMLAIQERDMNNNPLVTYTRGLDLSGSLQGAGGLGGLLARTDGNGSTFYHADALGNITVLMNGSQNIVARYLYNPYGKLTGMWGPMAPVNEMQFSSMPQHDGLVFYPFRAYEPNFQRWLTPDPIGERGGINLYRAMNNNPLRYIDPFGLEGNPTISTIPGLSGAWNINPSGPGGSFYGPGYSYIPYASMPFDAWRSLFSQNEYNDTAWYDANRPNSVAAAKKHFNDLIRDRAKNSKPCKGKDDFVVHAQKGGEVGHSEWELGDPEQSDPEDVLWVGDYVFRLGDVNVQPNDAGGFNYSADISLIDKLGPEDKYTDAMPGYARDFVNAVFGPSREYTSGHWQISGATQ
jgi:RHS repeat-associated protein